MSCFVFSYSFCRTIYYYYCIVRIGHTCMCTVVNFKRFKRNNIYNNIVLKSLRRHRRRRIYNIIILVLMDIWTHNIYGHLSPFDLILTILAHLFLRQPFPSIYYVHIIYICTYIINTYYCNTHAYLYPTSEQNPCNISFHNIQYNLIFFLLI